MAMVNSSKQTALITGCSEGGIGDALAQEFHRRGVRVLATGRNLEKLAHLRKLGIEIVQLDVESSESIKEAAAAVNRYTEGKLDFLVNNSGCGYNATILDTDIEQAKKMFNVNLFGLVEVTQAFAPQVIAAKGQIINIGSLVGIIPLPLQGLYNASKAAVHSLSDTLRIEMAPFGVKVIYIMTGGVRTKFFLNAPKYDFPEGSPYEAARDILEPILAGRTTDIFLTTPEEFAKSVAKNSFSWWPSTRVWPGFESLFGWFVTTFFWHTALDGMLSSRFGFKQATPKLAHVKN